jgi:late competence protein required for DNA uptake (superfamily II DNA/RNA helicase)
MITRKLYLIVWLLKVMIITLIPSNSKHLWIKKATGLGISEFMLRFMAWLCLKDNALAGSQMCIVTGPRIDLAIALIDRMKKTVCEW